MEKSRKTPVPFQDVHTEPSRKDEDQLPLDALFSLVEALVETTQLGQELVVLLHVGRGLREACFLHEGFFTLEVRTGVPLQEFKDGTDGVAHPPGPGGLQELPEYLEHSLVISVDAGNVRGMALAPGEV